MMFDMPREVWEEPGYTVAEHTNSRPVNWALVRQVVIHYTADKRANPDTAQYLRNMQRSYVNNRGYSLGYNVAVDQQGLSWEIRGVDYRPAANVEVNNTTYTILALVNWQDACNGVMVDSIRDIVQWARQQAGRRLEIVGHRDVGSTRCPGDGIYNQITGNVFEPTEDLDMRIINPPVRAYDSRKQQGRFKPGETRKIHVGRNDAVFVNLTAVDAQGWGFITAWGDGPMPDVSNVNYNVGMTIANSAWVPVAADGCINVFSHAATDVLVDVQAVAS